LVQAERARERLQRKVIKAIDCLESKNVLRAIRRATKKIIRKADAGGASVRTPAAFILARQSVLRQLGELLQQQDSLADSQDQRGHHAMRIAAKRLRYTLEIARPVYPGQFDETVEAIKQVQSLLGDIHDCDVWNEHLDAFVAKERTRLISRFGHAGQFAHLQPGVDYLRQERRNHREKIFTQLVEYWAELNSRRLWERLRNNVLDSPAAPPPPLDLPPPMETMESHGA
jgi:CHAD domain-containing protein